MNLSYDEFKKTLEDWIQAETIEPDEVHHMQNMFCGWDRYFHYFQENGHTSEIIKQLQQVHRKFTKIVKTIRHKHLVDQFQMVLNSLIQMRDLGIDSESKLTEWGPKWFQWVAQTGKLIDSPQQGAAQAMSHLTALKMERAHSLLTNYLRQQGLFADLEGLLTDLLRLVIHCPCSEITALLVQPGEKDQPPTGLAKPFFMIRVQDARLRKVFRNGIHAGLHQDNRFQEVVEAGIHQAQQLCSDQEIFLAKEVFLYDIEEVPSVEGDSICAAAFLCAMGLLTGNPFSRTDFAVTGGVQGAPVGGSEMKVNAAFKQGIPDIAIPQQNALRDESIFDRVIRYPNFEELWRKFQGFGTLDRESSQIYHKKYYKDKSLFPELLAEITPIITSVEGENLESLPFEEALRELWKQGKRHIGLVGQGGMGKTTTLLNHWKTVLERETDVLPLYVPLEKINNTIYSQEKNWILQLIAENYLYANQVAGMHIDSLRELLNEQERRFDQEMSQNQGSSTKKSVSVWLLLLDGYNEIAEEKLSKIHQSLNELAELHSISIVLTSRENLPRTNYFQPERLELEPLHDEIVCDWLKNQNLAYPEHSNTQALLRVPLYLCLYALSETTLKHYTPQLNPDIRNKLAQPPRVASDLMERVIEALLQKALQFPSNFHLSEKQTETLLRILVLELIPQMAYIMESRNQYSLTWGEILKTGEEVWKQPGTIKYWRRFAQSQPPDWELVDMWLKGYLTQQLGMLEPISEITVPALLEQFDMETELAQEFGFVHQTFRDFFAAFYLLNEVKIPIRERKLPSAFEERILPIYLQQFVGELGKEHLKEPRWIGEHFRPELDESTLFEGLLDMCRGKSYQEVAYTLHNLFGIFKVNRKHFAFLDLSNMDLEWISLNNIPLSQRLKDGRVQAATFERSLVSHETFFPQRYFETINSVSFSPNGQILASTCSDNTIKIWDIHVGTVLRTLQEHSGKMNSISFSPDGRILASISRDTTIKIRDWHAGKVLCTLQGHLNTVTLVCFSPNDQTLASASKDTTIKIWDFYSGECLKTLEGHSDAVTSACFSPDGQTLASASKDTIIKIWDCYGGECLKTLEGHSKEIMSFCFSPDGQTLASASKDTTIKIWDCYGGECLQTLQGHSKEIMSFCFSPDGQTLASASEDTTIKIWDCYGGECLQTLQGHSSGARSVCFSPNGQILASAVLYKTIKIWDVHTGVCLQTFQGFPSLVKSIAFSPDSQTLASAFINGTVKIWEITKDNEVQEIHTLPNIPGLWVQGVDLSNLDSRSTLSQEDKKLLKQYGAKLQD